MQLPKSSKDQTASCYRPEPDNLGTVAQNWNLTLALGSTRIWIPARNINDIIRTSMPSQLKIIKPKKNPLRFKGTKWVYKRWIFSPQFWIMITKAKCITLSPHSPIEVYCSRKSMGQCLSNLRSDRSTLHQAGLREIGPLLSLIHIWRCRRIERCRSRWSPYH